MADEEDSELSLGADALAALQDALGHKDGSVSGAGSALAAILAARRAEAVDSDSEGEDDERGVSAISAAAARLEVELEAAESSSEDSYVPTETHAEYYRRLFPERYQDDDQNEEETNTSRERVALVTMDDEYVQRLLVKAISKREKWRVVRELPEQFEESFDLHWGEYEHIDWFNERGTCDLNSKMVVSCYYNRKGLIRKGNLAYTLEKWQTKYRESRAPLAPKSYVLTLSSGGEIGASGATFEQDFEEAYAACGFPGFYGEGETNPTSREHSIQEGCVWILKPSVTNQANGISLIRSKKQLFDAVQRSDAVQRAGDFVIQRYLEPLLLDGLKFHLRVFMLLIGDITAYVDPDFLAIFSLEQYKGATLDETRAHLTNISHQQVLSLEDQHRCMRLFSETAQNMVDSGVAADLKEAASRIQQVRERVLAICAETVEAACGELTFQPKNGCFELYGLDFMIDPEWGVWLLEANAQPDLSKAGDRLQPVIDKVLEDSLSLVIEENKYLRGSKEDNVGTASGHHREEGKDPVRMVQVFKRSRK